MTDDDLRKELGGRLKHIEELVGSTVAIKTQNRRVYEIVLGHQILLSYEESIKFNTRFH